MFGYQVIELKENVKYKIARLEKAILDYLYLNVGINSKEDFEGLRWNRQQLGQLEDNPLFFKYLKFFGTQALESRVMQLMEYIHA